MFGHVVDRDHSSRWPTVSILFAAALASSFAMVHRSSGPRLGIGTMLAIAIVLSGLRVGVMLIGAKRRRRDRKAQQQAAQDETAPGEQPTEEPRPTYEDVFGAPAGSEPPADQVEPAGDGEAQEPGGEIETADDDGDGDWMSAEVDAGDVHEDVHEDVEEEDATEEGATERLEAEIGQTSADVEAIKSELESEEAIRRLREEFRTKATEAALRIQQRHEELDQGSSAPTSV